MRVRPAFLYLPIAAFISASLFFVSCEKSQRDLDTETISTKENAIAYHIYDDVFREVHRFAMRDSLLNDTGIVQWFDDCISTALTSDTVAVFPMNLNLNYVELDDTTTCNDGFRRNGNITATFTGKYLNKGTSVTYRFSGYRKDGFIVGGKMTLTNMGVNEDGRRYYTLTVEEGSILGNGSDFTWEATSTLVWVAGSSTDGIIDDDIFEYTEGYSNGTNSRGNTFNSEIDIPYRADCSCQWFTSGTAQVDVKNLQSRFITYGIESVCDNILIQKRDQTSTEVSIPY